MAAFALRKNAPAYRRGLYEDRHFIAAIRAFYLYGSGLLNLISVVGIRHLATSCQNAGHIAAIEQGLLDLLCFVHLITGCRQSMDSLPLGIELSLGFCHVP